MYSAVPVASGTANTIATSPIMMLPGSTAAMPKWPWPASGCHRWVLRNDQPATRSACQPRPARPTLRRKSATARWQDARSTKIAALRPNSRLLAPASRQPTQGPWAAIATDEAASLGECTREP